MESTKFIIKYSPEFELQRVLSTRNRIQWYMDNKYSLDFLVFPKNITANTIESLSESEILKSINTEYDEEFFKKHISTLNSYLPRYLDKFPVLFKELGIDTLSNIEIYLTRYGMGGSYNIPNIIIVNVSRFYDIGLIRTILHETIHLHIQGLIGKYKIDQWQKEAIVDCIFEKVFPELLKRQDYKEDVSKTQKTFNDNYPNLKLIMETVGALSKQ